MTILVGWWEGHLVCTATCFSSCQRFSSISLGDPA